MSTLATFAPLFATREKEEVRTAPPRPDTGPVFIHDAIVPIGHSTLLLQLWRRWDDTKPDDQP